MSGLPVWKEGWWVTAKKLNKMILLRWIPLGEALGDCNTKMKKSRNPSEIN